jgi:LmbE family N-acetylglucosaminyl deacetylase/tetratricopeptide (TPR) repeat protein
MKKNAIGMIIAGLLLSGALVAQEYLREFQEGQTQFRAGKLLVAKENLEKSLLLYPDYLPALKLLAETYIRLDRYDDAMIRLKRVLLVNPDETEVKLSLADVYAWKGEHDRALGLYRDVAEEHAGDIAAKMGIAKVLRWEQHFDEAMEQYLEVLALAPGNLDALRGLAKTYAFLDDYAKALETIDQAIAVAPRDFELFRDKGEILAWQNSFSAAEANYKKALALNPRDAETHMDLGNLYAWNRKYEEAVASYSQAAHLDDRNPNHLISLAKAYIAWDKSGPAELALEKALKMEPQNTQALGLLQELRQKPEIDWTKLIKKFIKPVYMQLVLVIIAFYFWRRKHLFRHRSRLELFFFGYMLPLLIMGAFAGFSFAFWTDLLEPGSDLVVEILEIVVFTLLGLAVVSLLLRLRSSPRPGENVLFIGAHPDDIELGCGGTVARMREEGKGIFVLVLSTGEKGGAGAEQRKKEAEAAAYYLHVNGIRVCDFPDTQFGLHLNAMVAEIEAIVKKEKIRTIFTHTANDIHQDHRAVHEASRIAARGNISLFCYEDVSTDQQFVPNFFVDIGEFMEIKLAAVRFHKSQLGKSYMGPTGIIGRAAHRGLQADVKSAEAFLALKIVSNG